MFSYLFVLVLLVAAPRVSFGCSESFGSRLPIMSDSCDFFWFWIFVFRYLYVSILRLLLGCSILRDFTEISIIGLRYAWLLRILWRQSWNLDHLIRLRGRGIRLTTRSTIIHGLRNRISEFDGFSLANNMCCLTSSIILSGQRVRTSISNKMSWCRIAAWYHRWQLMWLTLHASLFGWIPRQSLILFTQYSLSELSGTVFIISRKLRKLRPWIHTWDRARCIDNILRIQKWLAVLLARKSSLLNKLTPGVIRYITYSLYFDKLMLSSRCELAASAGMKIEKVVVRIRRKLALALTHQLSLLYKRKLILYFTILAWCCLFVHWRIYSGLIRLPASCDSRLNILWSFCIVVLPLLLWQMIFLEFRHAFSLSIGLRKISMAALTRRPFDCGRFTCSIHIQNFKNFLFCMNILYF